MTGAAVLYDLQQLDRDLLAELAQRRIPVALHRAFSPLFLVAVQMISRLSFKKNVCFTCQRSSGTIFADRYLSNPKEN